MIEIFGAGGLSIDVLRAVSCHVFDQLSARKLVAGIYSLNVAVVKAFLRIGFTVDGSLRKQLRVDEGCYCDHVLLSCFENELARE